ncbi:MAG: hypothetical protein JO307_15090 [Bryobacterales bacterium]|nr:hypothetical protein [Bryobacterales bacterium]MBV9397833.1 hypothetical protein [Bryobacterales bacterium]
MIVAAVLLGYALLVPLAAIAQSRGEAVIVNSGSTNTAGFRIVIGENGDAQYTVMPRRFGPPAQSEPVRRKLPEALAQRFFSHLDSAKPLANLPHERCAKSASFGTSLTIEFGGERTPDLSCPDPQDPHIQTLMRDAEEITKIFQTSTSRP